MYEGYNLIEKGYKFLDSLQDLEQAKEIARQYRANGYFAQVVKEISIKPHRYAVFIKPKKKTYNKKRKLPRST